MTLFNKKAAGSRTPWQGRSSSSQKATPKVGASINNAHDLQRLANSTKQAADRAKSQKDSFRKVIDAAQRQVQQLRRQR